MVKMKTHVQNKYYWILRQVMQRENQQRNLEQLSKANRLRGVHREFL